MNFAQGGALKLIKSNPPKSNGASIALDNELKANYDTEKVK